MSNLSDMKRETQNQPPLRRLGLDEIRRICRLWGFKEDDIPEKCPYDNGCGLTLPDYLTDKELRRIGQCIQLQIMKHKEWYAGDLIIWLKAHKDTTPVSFEAVRAKWQMSRRFSTQSLYNWKSTASKYPRSERRPELLYDHHERARGLPHKERMKLLQSAIDERLSHTVVSERSAIWQGEHQGGSRGKALHERFIEKHAALHKIATERGPYSPHYRAILNQVISLGEEMSKLARKDRGDSDNDSDDVD